MTAGGASLRNLALTGIPRGGTTLACRLLGQCQDSIALFEPMQVASLPRDVDDAVREVSDFFVEARRQLREHGVAPSKQHDGVVPDNPFAEPALAGERESLVTPGHVRPLNALSPQCTVVIKHNAAFCALLPNLAQTLPTLAIVRNPLAVLASWRSVPLPVRDGRLPAGERLDPALAGRLEAEPDLLRRQLHVLNWFFERFAAHLAAEQVLRYEDIIAGQGGPLFAAARLQPALTVAPLSERNSQLRVDTAAARELLAALLADEGAWRRWYRESELHALLAYAHAP